jgi:MraZ protein
MFIGKYYHKLEVNGRVMIPKEFRNAQNFVITRGLDGSLFLFKAEDFEIELRKLSDRSFTKKINRDFIRLMTNEAQNLAVDKNGRVQLPEYLISFAGFDKDLVFVGSMNRIEIWNQQKYHTYLDTIENDAEKIAEQLEEKYD